MLRSLLYLGDETLKGDVSQEELKEYLDKEGTLLWLDLDGPDEEEVEVLSKVFKFHPLAIEDCLDVTHSPKLDNFGDHLFLIFHAPIFDEEKAELKTVELNLFLGKNYLVTFHRQPLFFINQALLRCKKHPSMVLGMGADFLAHSILDALVDQYQPIFNFLDKTVEVLEDEIFFDPSHNYLPEFLKLKKEALFLKRVIIDQREILRVLLRGDFPFISQKVKIYFRDIYENIDRYHDVAERIRDLVVGIQEAYLAQVNNQFNDVLKFLTVIATLSLPIALITGIYGMNFPSMPGLQWKYGYSFVMGIMTTVTILMLWYFKKKRWF